MILSFLSFCFIIKRDLEFKLESSEFGIRIELDFRFEFEIELAFVQARIRIEIRNRAI